MGKLIIDIELMSEAIFGSGESSTSFVDVEILKDEYGIPYFKGKTFKGKLREEVQEISRILFGETDENLVEKMFGGSYSNEGALLRFSDCTVDKNVINNLKYGIDEKLYTKEELTEAFTDVRTFTKLDKEGIAENGSLRKSRVIRKGLKLYCQVSTREELNIKEKGLLAAGVSALRNLGSMESRGKGQVLCILKEDFKDVTNKYIEDLRNEVKKIG